jgi:uridylate kinase
MNDRRTPYDRAILKISGETLSAPGGPPFDPGSLKLLISRIREGLEGGCRLGIVCGGGNIIRGRLAGRGLLDRTTTDGMGMLATVINGLAIRDGLERSGIPARLFSSVPAGTLAEPYSPRGARAALENGEVAVFSGGTGNPYVSTDTAAVLRACDIGAGTVLKATTVDGIYSADPKIDPAARRFDRVSYVQALTEDLRIMDGPAIALARENKIMVIVFDFRQENAIRRAVGGEPVGTILN